MLTPDEVANVEPDFEALKRVAAAWFGISARAFFDLPQPEIERVLRLADVTPEQFPGFCVAVMRVHHLPKDCPLVN